MVGEIKYDIGGHGSGSEHGANGDADGDTASDDTRVGWSGGGGGGKGKLGLGKRKKIDKGKGKAKDEGEEEENANPNPNPNPNGQKTEYESNRKKRGRPVEVRVWGELYRGIEEWLPRAEGQDKVYVSHFVSKPYIASHGFNTSPERAGSKPGTVRCSCGGGAKTLISRYVAFLWHHSIEHNIIEH